MNETQERLLERGVMVLPEEIDHRTYEYVLEGLLLRADEPVVLYCAGEGGAARVALAIVDVIQQHGKVIGLLPGPAVSCHATVWAGCATRFVFPHGRIGVHLVSWSTQRTLDAHSLDVLADEFDELNQATSRILAGASKQAAHWWFDMMQRGGSHGFRMFHAAALIDMAMAQPAKGLALNVAKEPSPTRAQHTQTGINAAPLQDDARVNVVVGDMRAALFELGYRVVYQHGSANGSKLRGPHWRAYHVDYGNIAWEFSEDAAWEKAQADAVARGWLEKINE